MFDSTIFSSKLLLVIEVGLAVAFLTELFTESSAAFDWIKALRAKFRKPFGCSFCMSWWFSLLIWVDFYVTAITEYRQTGSFIQLFVEVCASAFVSLLWLSFLKKLDITVV